MTGESDGAEDVHGEALLSFSLLEGFLPVGWGELEDALAHRTSNSAIPESNNTRHPQIARRFSGGGEDEVGAVGDVDPSAIVGARGGDDEVVVAVEVEIMTADDASRPPARRPVIQRRCPVRPARKRS